ncbi:MAG: GIY-YIG nuclease family protein [Porticoccaceae bacterium]|nr:MAG: GIY-YIG nuclease family protein [Porticoccaceae bacterium]
MTERLLDPAHMDPPQFVRDIRIPNVTHTQIGSIEFRYVCNLKPELGGDGAVVSLMPLHRYKNARNLPLNAYGVGPFCKFRIPRQFNASGVYALVVGGSVKYIGECINLSSRYNAGYGNISPRNCFKGGQETNCRINALVHAESKRSREVELWFHASSEHKQLEKRLLVIGSYEWNK